MATDDGGWDDVALADEVARLTRAAKARINWAVAMVASGSSSRTNAAVNDAATRTLTTMHQGQGLSLHGAAMAKPAPALLPMAAVAAVQ